MNGSVVNTGRATVRHPSRGWRLRAWPNDVSALLLVFDDHSATPNLDDFENAIDAARRLGASRLRTSALFPLATKTALEAGFCAIDSLALLGRQLERQLDPHLLVEVDRGPTPRAMRRWHHRRAAELDQRAFGQLWGNDAGSLADVRTATPIHHARFVGSQGAIAGFAISGAGGETGYVQRLAVAPEARRRGIGRRLVIDAMAWMVARRLTSVHVNTGVHNSAALRLYEGLGFVQLDARLTIAERSLA